MIAAWNKSIEALQECTFATSTWTSNEQQFSRHERKRNIVDGIRLLIGDYLRNRFLLIVRHPVAKAKALYRYSCRHYLFMKVNGHRLSTFLQNNPFYLLFCTARSSTPFVKSGRRISNTCRLCERKSSVNVISHVRGCGKEISNSATIRPGRGLIAITRSASKMASSTSCVIKKTVVLMLFPRSS